MSLKYLPSRYRWGWSPTWFAPDNVMLRILGVVLVVGNIALHPTHAVGSDIVPVSRSLAEAEPFQWLYITSSPTPHDNPQQQPLVAEASSEMHSWSGFLTDQTGSTFAQSQDIPNSAYGNSVVTTGIDVTQLIRGDLAYQFSSERQAYFPDTGPSLFENKSQKYNGAFPDCNFDMDVREALGKSILCGNPGSKEFVTSHLDGVETSEREAPLPAAVWVFGFALFGFVFLSNHRYS